MNKKINILIIFIIVFIFFIINHILKNIYNENYNNELPNNFSYMAYQYYNNNLINMTYKELKKHFLTYDIKQNKKYKFDNIEYYKINYINGITWINLDRSINRKKNMENILKNINIPSYRINAVDGKNEDVHKIINGINVKEKMTNYEIACALSHLKAINYVSKLKGDYFMICEDDVIFDNINVINEDLKNIIQNCPEFDILLLTKSYKKKLPSTYTNWNNYFKNNIWITGAVCYIISRKGIENILKIANYENNILHYDKSIYFSNSDKFLYLNSNTYVYKYNYISTLGTDSEIHSSHLDFHNTCIEKQNKYILEDFYNK